MVVATNYRIVNHRLEGIQFSVNKTRASIEDLKAESQLENLRRWLSPTDPSVNFNKAKELRNPGSGQWLLESEEYSQWKAEKNSLLWLYGIPGCGKTILSATVIEDLIRKSYQDTLYFYFDFNDAQKQTLENMIRSLADQLYNKKTSVRKHLDALYSFCDDGKSQPDIESLGKTLQTMVQKGGEVWIVLDALDECRTRRGQPTKGLLSWIHEFRVSQTNARFIVTSRREQDIKSCIETWPHCIPIALESDLVADDIRKYVATRVKEQGRWHPRPDLQKEMESTLTAKAYGM